MNIMPKTPFPTTIAAGGQWQSGVMPFDDLNVVSAAAKSTQAGAITIQAYLDNAGLIPIGAAATTALVASTLETVSLAPGAGSTPFAALSYQVTVTNTSGSTATISNMAINAQHT